MAIEVVGIVVAAPSAMTMGTVGLQDAHHIEELESTPLDTLPLMVGDQGGITPGRLLTLLLLMAAARIGGILVALGEAGFNVLSRLLLVKDHGGWLCVYSNVCICLIVVSSRTGRMLSSFCSFSSFSSEQYGYKYWFVSLESCFSLSF